MEIPMFRLVTFSGLSLVAYVFIFNIRINHYNQAEMWLQAMHWSPLFVTTGFWLHYLELYLSFIVVVSHQEEVENMKELDAVSGSSKLLSVGVRKQIAFMRAWCLIEAYRQSRWKTCL